MIVVFILLAIFGVAAYLVIRVMVSDWYHEAVGREKEDGVMLPPPPALHDWSKKP